MPAPFRRPLLTRRRLALELGAALLLALAVRFSEHPGAGGPALAFLGFIIDAIITVAGWFAQAGTAAAEAIAAVVGWLTTALSWLTERVANIVGATGAMFAKVWEVTKALWFDVLKPALSAVYIWVKDLQAWLRQKFAPLFDLVARLRAQLKDIWTTFVRPVLDVIDWVRGVLSILKALHIQWAAALDQTLAGVEGWINDNFAYIWRRLAKVQSVLDGIVTGELLFQQVPFLLTMQRDTPYWVRLWWNAQITPVTQAQVEGWGADQVETADPAKLRGELALYYTTGGGELAPVIREIIPLWSQAAIK